MCELFVGSKEFRRVLFYLNIHFLNIQADSLLSMKSKEYHRNY